MHVTRERTKGAMVTDDVSALQRLLSERRSCRNFTKEPVSVADVETLLHSAQVDPEMGWPHPSAHDLRPVTVDVVPAIVSRTVIEAAAFDDQPWLAGGTLLLAITADLRAVSAEFADQDDTGLRGRDFAFIEAGAVAQSLLLTVTALGLGGVLVAGIRQREMQGALNTDRHVVGLIAVGHVDEGLACPTHDRSAGV